MSAPIAACAIADAIGALSLALSDQMGRVRVQIDWMPVENHSKDGVFQCVIYDHAIAFSGMGGTPSRALMEANSERQTYEEALRRGPQEA